MACWCGYCHPAQMVDFERGHLARTRLVAGTLWRVRDWPRLLFVAYALDLFARGKGSPPGHGATVRSILELPRGQISRKNRENGHHRAPEIGQQIKKLSDLAWARWPKNPVPIINIWVI